jgi:hypothetical protein
VAIPNSRLEVIKGAGHAPHLEDPTRFAQILADFLSTTEPFRLDPEEMRDLLRQDTAAS